MKKEHISGWLAAAAVVCGMVLMSGCVLNPFVKTSDKKEEAARAEGQLKSANLLKNAFLKYHYDTGEYPQSFDDFERYVTNARAYEDVKITVREQGGHLIAYKMGQADGSYTLVQFYIETGEKPVDEVVIYDRPMRDLIQKRVYEMDGHRAGRFKANKNEKKTAKNGDTVIKERNHDGYVD